MLGLRPVLGGNVGTPVSVALTVDTCVGGLRLKTCGILAFERLHLVKVCESMTKTPQMSLLKMPTRV